MAYLHSDSFDVYATASDATLRWDSSTGGSVVSSANTAFGVGQGWQFSAGGNLIKTLPSNESTIFLNLRKRQVGGTSNIQGLVVLLRDGTTAQCGIRWNEDTSIVAFSGGSNANGAGTTLATASAAFLLNTWDSYQIKVVIHATAGSIEVRKNGSSTPLLSVSGVNTRGGTANVYANNLYLGGTVNNSGTHSVDDVVVCSGSGAAPNDWLPDLRAITPAPSATVQGQWSQSPSATTWGQLTSSTTLNTGMAASTIKYTKLTPTLKGSCSQIALSLAAAITGKLNVALYDSDGTSGGPGTLLAQGAEVTNPGVGTQTFTLGSTVSIAANHAYYIAVWSSAATNSGTFNGISGTIQAVQQALTYSSTFPASGPGGATSTIAAPYLSANLTGIDSFSLVGETTQDGDSSYIFSSTTGQEDLYSFPSLAAQGVSPASIFGVLPFAIARKSDSGARTLSVRAKSGATDAAVVTDSGLSLSYKFEGAFLATDPATSAAWTPTGLNGLQVGVKVDA